MPGFRTVNIKRFKNITEAHFELGEINILVGANNSGKSSILQAIHFAVGATQSLKLEGLLKGHGEKTSTVNPAKLIYVPSEDVHALGIGGRLWEEAEKSVQIELCITSGELLSVSMNKGRNRNIQITVSDVDVAAKLADIESPFSIFTPGLAGVSKSEQYVSDGVLLRTIARGDANLVLRNTLLRLWGDDGQRIEWKEFTRDLNVIFPNIGILVAFNPKTDETIDIRIKTDYGGIPLELSGTGVLQAIQILSYIHCFRPNVIVLDEPDSHLHPDNQRLLCSLLDMIAQTKGVQVLLSTHSRHVLDALKGIAQFLWARNGAVDIVTDGSELAVLLDIGALDVKERIKATDKGCVVLTEDKIPSSLKKVLESSGFDMKLTDVLSYNGCTSPHNLRPLIHVIKDHNAKATIIVHQDRDYYSDKENTDWEAQIRSMGGEPFVTDGVDIESHLLNAEYLEAVNENLTYEEAQQLINQAILDTREQSIQHCVNGRFDIEKKRGKHGQVNIGELAVWAHKEYDANPHRYCHGKTTMAKVRELFQANKSTDLKSQVKSEFIASPTLSGIAKRIFMQAVTKEKTPKSN